MSRRGRAHDALMLAGEHTPPACEGDDMFISDSQNLIPADMERMRLVCNRCALFDLCAAYARTARPEAGFWAGLPRERRTGRISSATDDEEVNSMDENGDLIDQEVPC